MPPKNAKPTSDELLAQLENLDDLGVDTEDLKTEPKAATTTKTDAPPEQDPFAELNDLVFQRPASRAATPRLSSELPHRPSPKLTSAATPPAGRTSEDAAAPRKSTETGRTSREAPSEPASKRDEETPQGQGGGWWGSIFSTASAAVKQAEAAVKEIQKNEEAQKWAEQLRGNVGSLRELGGELRTLAIPTFTNLLHTLAPPISSHERLQVHITHDLSGYPEIDPIVHAVFARVMSQVEGGDLLVVQRGQESGPKRGGADSGYLSSAAGWHDGPWWRTVTPGNPRTISAVKGAVEGTKLARASAEAYASEYFSSRGGVEEAAKHATEVLSESNPVRSSDIFLAIQAINQTAPKDLFQAGPTTEKATPKGAIEVEDDKENEEVFFALYLHDPIHGIAFHTLSQAIPQKWIDWLDAPAPAAADADSVDAEIPHTVVPDSIAEIIESGGVDPREWVSEWVEESLSLAIGVVAQRYVARRMGVGEGGVNKGKMRAEKTSTVESGAGEAARAL